MLTARREDRIKQLADELGNALAVPCDVTDHRQVTSAVAAAVEHFGRIDVLVNNAGQGLQAKWGDHLPVEVRERNEWLATLESLDQRPLPAVKYAMGLRKASRGIAGAAGAPIDRTWLGRATERGLDLVGSSALITTSAPGSSAVSSASTPGRWEVAALLAVAWR